MVLLSLESDATSRHDQACSSQAGDGVPEEEACLTNNVLTCSEPKLHSPLLTFQLLGGAHCQFCRLISSVCVCVGLRRSLWDQDGRVSSKLSDSPNLV